MNDEEPEGKDTGLRTELVRLAWAAAFFVVVLGAFVLLFAVGLFH